MAAHTPPMIPPVNGRRQGATDQASVISASQAEQEREPGSSFMPQWGQNMGV